jgi:DNA gyrase subunit A
MKDINDKIIEVSLEDEMSESFINYSKELIENRSIPSIYDGLKPVQRRILYAMHELKIYSTTSYRKSARVVGEVLGKYHPHGDSSVYDAMVRMSQWWSMRYPLIDLQGNGGSIDGDSPAAMRYTEVKLTSLVDEFTKDLDKGCINWNSNFDNSLKEPEILPTLFPNYLLNGGSGIAVGVSCDIPPHNLGELIDAITFYIDNSNCTIADLLKILKGPDFPTGGIIEGANLLDIYTKGTGTFKVRAKHKIEQGTAGKQLIIINDIPYQTTKGKILSQLSQLYIDKKLDGVIDIRDESTLDEKVRIVLEIKKDIDPNYILKKIFAKTSLEVTQKVNLRAVIDGKLRLISIKDYFNEYLNFQKSLLVKKIQYILEKHNSELHVLEGYIKCITNIDKVIEIIKKSKTPDTAKKSLMKEFSIDEIQAQAILDLRLRRLTSLEINEIKRKKKELTTEVKRLNKIISSDKSIYDEIKNELVRLKNTYGDKRRSKVQNNFKKIVAEKPVVEFYISIKDKNIKTYQTRNFKFDGDILLETDNTKDLIMISPTGIFYRFSPDKIPTKVPLSIVGGFTSDFSRDDNRILTLITRKGMIKRSYISEYNIKRSQSTAIKLENNDEIIKAIVSDDKKSLDILLINNTFGYAYFDINEVSPTGRNTRGVKAICNKNDEKIIHAVEISEVKKIVLVCSDEEKIVSVEELSKSEQGDRKSIKRVIKNLRNLQDIRFIYKDINKQDIAKTD